MCLKSYIKSEAGHSLSAHFFVLFGMFGSCLVCFQNLIAFSFDLYLYYTIIPNSIAISHSEELIAKSKNPD